MRTFLLAITCTLGFSGLVANAAEARPARVARLSAAVQKWVQPLLELDNVEYAELHAVLAEETAPKALIAGSGKSNSVLTRTLLAFAACAGVVRKAGPSPSARLSTFQAALVGSCAELGKGGNGIAKATGAILKGSGKLAQSWLVQATADLKQGSVLLGNAERARLTVGGKHVFEA